MSVSRSQKYASPHITLRQKYDALKYATPEILQEISKPRLGFNKKSPTHKNHPLYQKALEYHKDCEEITEERMLHWYDYSENQAFLIRNKNMTSQDKEKRLNTVAENIKKYPPSKKMISPDRFSVDIFGNFFTSTNPECAIKPNIIDPLSVPLLSSAKYEMNSSANKYRELIASTLNNPQNRIDALSTDHYGVYPAHDHSKKQPHLLIIPHHKKFKNIADLFNHGTTDEIKDYLRVLEKVANQGPRQKKLEHELFFSDCGALQKVPFFYSEYIPRRTYQAPDKLAPHIGLMRAKISDITGGKNILPPNRRTSHKKNMDKKIKNIHNHH